MFFAYTRHGRPTGKVVAEALGMPHGRRIIRFDGDVLLRWGSQIQYDTDYRWKDVINTCRALANASDKLRAFQLMEAYGVRVPPFGTNTIGMDGATILGRTRHGARGRGITVYPDRGHVVRRHELYVQYIPNDREYRLHVVGDEIVRVQRKYLDFPEQRQTEYVKNYANGYRFRAPRMQLRPDRHEAAINAVKALGLHFGCVDLIVDHDDVAWVLEVNTAPSCSPLTAGAYVGRLAPMIEEMTGREVFTNYNALNLLGGGDEDRDTEEP